VAKHRVSLVAIDIHHPSDGLTGFDKDPPIEQHLSQKPGLARVARASDESGRGPRKDGKVVVFVVVVVVVILCLFLFFLFRFAFFGGSGGRRRYLWRW
jgi:hypothetical protein